MLTYVTSSGQAIYGRAYWITDLKLAYENSRPMLGRKIDYRIQLNVSNLLDEDNVVFNQANSTTGIRDIYYFIDPRTASLSLSFAF